jgi:hypothetical protein
MAARGKALQKAGRRAWPVLLMAWERWQALSPAQKERYMKQARQAAERGKRALQKQRKKRR